MTAASLPPANASHQAPELNWIRRDNITWLLLSQAFAIAPLLLQIAQWIWGLWALAIVWRWMIQQQRVREPNAAIKLLLAIACLLGLYLSYPQQTSMESMIGLLVCAFVLKQVELKTRKDGLLLIFIGFIAVAAQFLFAQTLLAGAYGVACCAVLLMAWQTVFYSKPHSTRFKLWRGLLLLLQSLPFMLVLFVVMPRIGPLWTVPLPESRGKTGFSDSLSPGDLSNLVKSSEAAFRVTFTAANPPAMGLYWRGLILDDYDGRTWRLHRGDSQALEPVPNRTEELLEYAVILEPHMQRWLFSLPRALKADAANTRIRVRPDGLVEASQPIYNRLQYTLVSALKTAYTPEQSLSPRAFQQYTQLPTGGDSRSRALAYQWRLAGLDTRQKMTQALQLYNAEFTYSLQPPMLGANAVDDFLFTSKRGFCEHFASSFAFLMRASGVPARVLVGYQGGRYNTVDHYLLVSQSDAHAWVEVWQDGMGWVTVDPTAAVAPNRIEQGVSQALPADERGLVGAENWRDAVWLLQWQQRWDALGYAWQRWVLNYDTHKQQGLFERLLGGVEIWRLSLALVLLAFVMALVFAIWLLHQRYSKPISQEAQLLGELLKRLPRHTVKPSPGETFGQYVTRLGDAEPRWRIPARQLKVLFEKVIYAGDTAQTARLKRHIRLFPRLPKYTA